MRAKVMECVLVSAFIFFFSSRRRHTRLQGDWSSDVCSSDLALNVKVNVADVADTKAMVDQVLKEWGKVDILVNNAGITRDGLLLRMKEEDWNLVLQVNLNGTFKIGRASCRERV